MPRRDLLVVRAACLALGELLADLVDVTAASPTSLRIDPEAERDVGRRQQGELLGGVVLGHTPIMKRGCDRVRRVPSALRPECGVVGIHPDDPHSHHRPLEALGETFEIAHHDIGRDLGVVQIDVHRVVTPQRHGESIDLVDRAERGTTDDPEHPHGVVGVDDVVETGSCSHGA